MKSYISRKFPQETRRTRATFEEVGTLVTRACGILPPVLRRTRRVGVFLVLGLVLAGRVEADEIRVITSGAFTAAYQALVPLFERASGHTIISTFGASIGSGPTTIP